MYSIKNVKCYEDGDTIRLVFDWQQGLSQVFITTQPDPTSGKLFTLQEYKKQAGYITPKIQGTTTYYIYPTQRENGKDIIYDPIEFTHTSQTIINFSLEEEIGQFKNHRLTIYANYPVPENVICYVKNKNARPENILDGVLYHFNEVINQPITRIISTAKNEYINLFIRHANNAKLYQLVQAK